MTNILNHNQLSWAYKNNIVMITIHWASKETYHIFRAKLTKIYPIKINNIWTKITLILLKKNMWKTKVCLCQKGEKCEIAKGHFSKITETVHRARSMEAAYSEHSIAVHSISIAGYVIPVPAFVCGKLPGREASSFCDFWKLTSCDFTTFFNFLTQANLCFLDVLNKDNYS